MNKIAFIILSFFTIHTCFAQDSLHWSSLSIGISATPGGNYYNFSSGLRYNRVEINGGLNIQIVGKNSYPVNKQKLNDPGYSNNIIGFHGGINYYINQSKINHILGVRYQNNSFLSEESSRGTTSWSVKNVIKQFSFVYKISFFGDKRFNVEPWVGYTVLVLNQTPACCWEKSYTIGLDITLRPYYFKR